MPKIYRLITDSLLVVLFLSLLVLPIGAVGLGGYAVDEASDGGVLGVSEGVTSGTERTAKQEDAIVKSYQIRVVPVQSELQQEESRESTQSTGSETTQLEGVDTQ